MSLFFNDPDRRMIPRWRTFRTTTETGELSSPTGRAIQPQINEEMFADKVHSWRMTRTLGFASDLVGAAAVLGRESAATDAAAFILDPANHATGALKTVAYRVLGQEPSADQQADEEERDASARFIRETRDRLREEPRNAIAWIDLGREYAVNGLYRQTLQCLKRGVILAPNNRFVLRSATRFFIHQKDTQRAYDILTRCNRTREDPWLLAAQIATATVIGRTSRFIKDGQRMTENRMFSDFEVGELASALATVDLGSGDVRRARRLFGRSLQRPTENSVAQAGWASRHISGVPLHEEHLRVPRTYEAHAWQFYVAQQWDRAVQNCQSWLRDEPYSKRPAIMGSYLAALMLDDYELSASVAKAGLRANRSDVLLLNNLTVALLILGRKEEAELEFAKIDRGDSDADTHRITLTATEGLLRFRTGKIQEGRMLYENAIAASATENQKQHALALIHLCREEMIAGTLRVEQTYKRAVQACEGQNVAEVQIMLDRIKTLRQRQGGSRSAIELRFEETP